jgi:hypothetical protein
MKRLLLVLAMLIVALIPRVAFAQATTSQSNGLILRINGDVHVAAGEEVDSIIVIHGNAIVDGTVHEFLSVIDGDATVTGTVRGDTWVVRGSLDLKPTATVKNVSVVRGDLIREPGSNITGSTSRYSDVVAFSWGFRILLWVGITLLVLAAGLLFAAIAGRQLLEMSALIRDRTAGAILAAVILWIAVPIVAVLLLITVIGIPVGIAILLFLLPALWFLGYLVSGISLGLLLLRLSHSTSEPEHPYLAAVAGLLLLQVIGFMPFIGGLVVVLAGLFGGGVLAYKCWRGWRGPAAARPAEAVPA